MQQATEWKIKSGISEIFFLILELYHIIILKVVWLIQSDHLEHSCWGYW